LNSFGRIFRINIFGESHGESVGLNVDGCPAGLPLSIDDFMEDIKEDKVVREKEQHLVKKTTCPFLKVACLMA
jgi:chorismate synthase